MIDVIRYGVNNEEKIMIRTAIITIIDKRWIYFYLAKNSSVKAICIFSPRRSLVGQLPSAFQYTPLNNVWGLTVQSGESGEHAT